MKYLETTEHTVPTREKYVKGFENLIRDRIAFSDVERKRYISDVFKDTQRYRDDLRRVLGWPLIDYVDDFYAPDPESELLASENGYDIYRMQFEVLRGFTISGLFFKLNGNEPRPLIICQHGGGGTPEVVCGLYEEGTGTYNDMATRVLAHGANVFAPQLLLWKSKIGAPNDRNDLDARLKNLGSSVTAIEIFAIQRIIDYFEKQEYVKSFGMTGQSYGGFYTLFVTALEDRITSAFSSSFFNSRRAIGWTDVTWRDLMLKFDDAEVACLAYPRKLYIAVADNDEIFDVKYARKSFEDLDALAKTADVEWVEWKIFEGKHEYMPTDEFLSKMINDLK